MKRVLSALFAVLLVPGLLVHSTEPADAQAATSDVLVYFLDGEELVVDGRTVQTVAVGAAAMEALLDGPAPGFETDLGLTTAIPSGTSLLGLDIAAGTATVDLSGEFEAGGGTASVTARVAQVVFTLTQFETVDAVDIWIDGAERDFVTGEGFPAQNLSRADFFVTDLAQAPTPLILVESPFIGEAVSSPLTISGWSNTFEANVRYQVTDPDGLIVIDSFTTASAGTGTWGTFSVTVDLPEFSRSGIASVIVFEDSAKDGSPINVVEVPVQVQGTESTPPIGWLDLVQPAAGGSVRVAGWTFDPDSPTATVDVHIWIDGVFAAGFPARSERADVAAAFPAAGPAHGFSRIVSVPDGVEPTGPTTVCAFAIDLGSGTNPQLGCRTVQLGTGLPLGWLDLVDPVEPGSVRVAGWTFDPDSPTATVKVHVWIDGVFAAGFPADVERADVGAAFPAAGPAHGFDRIVSVPDSASTLCAFALDIGPGPNPLLACRSL